MLHPRCHPRRDVHPVGHVADRDHLRRQVREQGLPHRPGHVAVLAADPVGRAAHPDPQRGQAEALVRLVRVNQAQAQEPMLVDAEPSRIVTEGLEQLLRRVGLVARRHRRVGGEHRPAPGQRQRFLERHTGRDVGAGHLQWRKGGVALVHVHDRGLDPHGPEGADASDPQQGVLGEPDPPASDVQAGGDPAVGPGVLRPLGVEQEQRDPSHVDPPDLHDHLAAPQGHGHREGQAVVPGHQGGGEAVGVGLHPVLRLPPGGVHLLVEDALAVKHADADHGDAPVRRRFEDVARQDAKAARVGGQGSMDPVFGTQEGHGPVGRPGRRVFGQVGLDLPPKPAGPLDQGLVRLRPGQGARGCLLEQPDRVLPAHAPPVGVDGLEDFAVARGPGPGVVVGEPGEGGQGRRHPGGEGLLGPGHVPRSSVRERGGGRAAGGHRRSLVVRRHGYSKLHRVRTRGHLKIQPAIPTRP